jgi:hypothetical protein
VGKLQELGISSSAAMSLETKRNVPRWSTQAQRA